VSVARQSPTHRQPIRHRLPTLLVVVAILSFACLALRAVYELERWRLGQELARQATVQAVELDRQLEQLGLVPRLLAGDPRLMAALQGTAGIERANRLLADVQQRSGLSFVFLMQASGRTVAASNHAGPLSFVGVNYGFRPYFQAAMQGEEASHFAVGATTGRPGYFVAVPMGNERTGPRGVVVAKIELDELVEAWRARPHDAFVLDADGVVVLSSDADLLYVPRVRTHGSARTAWPDGRPYRVDTERRLLGSGSGAWRMAAVGNGGNGTAGSEGPWIGSEAGLRTEAWTLVAIRSRQEALERALVGVAALGAALTIGALGWRVRMQRRRITRDAERSAAQLERLVDERTAELASAQRALIARSRFEMLGRMSAAINHEVNQPLASLRLNLASARALLAREAPPLDEIGDIVIDSDRTTRRIGRIIATLRSVAGTEVPLEDVVSLRALFEDTLATVRRERPAMADALHVDLPGETSTALGNAILLQQALLNLVYNALDAIRLATLGSVRLVAELNRSGADARPHAWVIDVTDDGPGVPDSVRPTLFEPFARADEQGSGLGIGLALSREIAERHGGTLELHERVGGGTTFRLTLPAAPPAAPST